MRLISNENVVVLLPETEQERAACADLLGSCKGHAFELVTSSNQQLLLVDRGPSDEALCRPVRIDESNQKGIYHLISNIADTPFELDGIHFASIESFRQSLKFNDLIERRLVATLTGVEAWNRGKQALHPDRIEYFGQSIVPDTEDYWHLYRRAHRAKFTQCSLALEQLLSTGKRPLQWMPHAKYSETLKMIQCDVWQKLRDEFIALTPEPYMGGVIESFAHAYRWLSNFYPAQIEFDGQLYPTVEHAYQAAKSTNEADRQMISNCPTPGEAKRLSREIAVRSDWDSMKVSVMRVLLKQKFQTPEMRKRLIATHPLQIVEGNDWGDVFWGVCHGRGENWLGKLLMEIRIAFLGDTCC